MAPANIAARAVALLIDGIVTFFGLGALVAIIAGQEHHANGSFGFNLHGGAALVWLVLAFGYGIVCEWFFGTTLGKRIFAIRVVGLDGARPSFGQALLRNVVRVVDGFPYVLPYLVGFVVAKSNAERQRLGDMLARTQVVSG
jgi:uncharacterized RDD family membrane protein YckC